MSAIANRLPINVQDAIRAVNDAYSGMVSLQAETDQFNPPNPGQYEAAVQHLQQTVERAIIAFKGLAATGKGYLA